MSAIKAVIFDLGETLLTFGQVNQLTVMKEANRNSYEYLKKLNQPVGRFWQYSISNIIAIWGRYAVSEITGRDFDSLAVMKNRGKRHKFTLTDQQWQQLNWLWYEPLAKIAKVDSDIADTLGKFKEMGLKLMILSNTFVHSSALIKHLKQLNIWKFFDDAVFSYEFNFRKPDKRIFLAAAEKICVDPEEVLFVGDRLKADIKGSMSCGMKAVLKKAYTNSGKKRPGGVACVEKLSELLAIVKDYNYQFCRKEICDVR